MAGKLLITNLDQPAVVRAAGALIRTWAVNLTLPAGGTDQIGGTSVRDLLAAAGVTFADPSIRVVLHQSTDTELHIHLPPKASLETAIQEITANPLGYSIAAPYRDFIVDKICNGGQGYDQPNEILPFYDYRIGDYTLQHCM